ncbi:MAG TPA: glycerol-3-phosphate 1-O-acyltransferase PlsY [Ignavibacteriales bacterium]|nr:glycerol-3-phosphate 1-O-acyltransferase PlsY [Ignavibacteriales bacterium]HRR19005.1 glycerol-3-phosphate 1-O-acyltransferase PlsY [Ignavibacteriales bacterium]HRT99188.1 glycerol-3-phosphate 1-O-acyltransferase PlsY [Ignavibacteriales bacterium]
MIASIFIAIIVSYLIGSIPTGLWLAKALKGIDIRTVGSGSTGGTNVTRVLGTGWGIGVIIFDAIKGISSVVISTYFLSGFENSRLLIVVASLFSILGHVWTIFANFKGGKGIATSLGVLLALLTIESLLALTVFIIVFIIFRIVSVSSLSAALALIFIVTAKYFYFHSYQFNEFIVNLPFVLILNILVFYTHRENIKRLLKGEEKKLELKKKV